MKTHCRQSAVIKKATAGVMIEQFTGPGISINLVPEGRSQRTGKSKIEIALTRVQAMGANVMYMSFTSISKSLFDILLFPLSWVQGHVE